MKSILENFIMNDKDQHDRLRQDCWNYALHSYGYAYTYSLRSEKMNDPEAEPRGIVSLER